MADLTTIVAGVKLKNPLILASGIMGVTASSLAKAAEAGAGAVTTKSIGLEKRPGHPNPIVCEVEGGLLNAVGLSSPSLEESIEELFSAVKRCGIPVIASVYGKTAEEFGEVAAEISKAKPALIEANISCPNVACEFGTPFGADPEMAAKVTTEIKANTKIPLSVKLTPNVSDIVSIAKAVEEAGAEAITAINTCGPGMAIDLETATPILSNKFGGLSGPAIKPIAVRCVYQIHEAVGIPLIGVGGVSSGRDAVEIMMAGASAVGVGTAVMYDDLSAFSKIRSEMEEFMAENGYSKLEELIGKAGGK